ncbi:MAG: pyridoxamine 5'-phosphate oxidase family protein [Candidatus Methanoperedenaceae archaeon]|nr:pyridoxamine 5'-phosphate oxidase family protein [Candidatus Methanoperedenaceae archaeon]
MVAMPDDVKNIFDNPECDKQKALTWVSTVTEDGDPHLAPVCFVKSIGNDKLLIGVSFISKTASNIKNGSRVAVGNAVYPNGYMIKGSGEVIETGKYFDDFKERINKRFGGKIKPKAVLLVSVEEIYHLKPAEGKKRIA